MNNSTGAVVVYTKQALRGQVVVVELPNGPREALIVARPNGVFSAVLDGLPPTQDDQKYDVHLKDREVSLANSSVTVKAGSFTPVNWM